MDINRALTVAVHAAKQAGTLIKRNYRARRKKYSYKDAHNIVTATDRAAERIIINRLGSAFPDHSIFSEEAGMQDKSSEYCWVIDPLDGTTNFSCSFPYFCTAIALVHRNTPLFGVVYRPMSNELFVAQRHGGVSFNGKRFRTPSRCTQVNRAVVFCTRSGTKREKQRFGEMLRLLAGRVRTFRVPGSVITMLCDVVLGRIDAVVTNGHQFYDTTAGALIAQEAGARTTDFRGNEWQFRFGRRSDLVVSNAVLHPKLLRILKQASL